MGPQCNKRARERSEKAISSHLWLMQSCVKREREGGRQHEGGRKRQRREGRERARGRGVGEEKGRKRLRQHAGHLAECLAVYWHGAPQQRLGEAWL